jgi:poly-gamma-glutamate synthesis protein (capsule biosynthesis protein)
MSSTITFVGDVMLGRMIGSKYGRRPYRIVSEELVAEAQEGDFIVANLESPVVETAKTEGDHLQFRGNPDTLNELKWINAFTLSNNHINDCGSLGMDETINVLNQRGFQHNGLFKGEYTPLVLEEKKIAIVTITDMMNIPFADDSQWDILRVGEQRVFDILFNYHEQGYYVILYAHIGILFSRYPNPITYDYLHQCIDNGADVIVTAHSHCLGCMELYKGKYIFHSLGDFVMDGNSFRRRRSGLLRIAIDNHQLTAWKIVPAEINAEYETVVPIKKTAAKMLHDFENVSGRLKEHTGDYERFFKWQYKKEMLLHISSTLGYLKKTRGAGGMMKMVCQRFEEVGRMFKWVAKDRSKDRRDDEAIRADRKRFTEDELFKN